MLPKEIGQVAQKGGFDGDLHISHTILEMASIDTCSDQNDDTHRVDCREQAFSPACAVCSPKTKVNERNRDVSPVAAGRYNHS
jgi:hypothetical protein